MMAIVFGAGFISVSDLMEVAPVKLMGGMVPKVYLNLLVQMRGDSAEPVIIGTLYLSTTGATARVTPEEYGPRMKSTFSWVISRSAAAAPAAGLDWASA